MERRRREREEEEEGGLEFRSPAASEMALKSSVGGVRLDPLGMKEVARLIEAWLAPG